MESTRVAVSVEKAEIEMRLSLAMAWASSPRQGCGWNLAFVCVARKACTSGG